MAAKWFNSLNINSSFVTTKRSMRSTVLSSHSTTHTELNKVTNLYLIYCEPRFSEVYCTIYLWAHFVNLEVDVKYLLSR